MHAMDEWASSLDADVLRRELGWARRLARGLVLEAHEADDVVQEAWIQGLRRRFPGGIPPRAWMRKALGNVARSRGRARTRRVDREAFAAEADVMPAAEDVVARFELCRALLDALHALPAPYDRVLYLRYVEGRSPADVARLLGRPPATVRSQCARGLALLREELAGSALDDEDALRGLAGLPLVSFASLPSAAVAAILAMKSKLLVAGITVAVVAWVGWSSKRGAEPTPVVDAGEGGTDTALVEPEPEAFDAPEPAEDVRVAETRDAEPAAAPAATPLLWRVVDARTGEVVPGVELSVEDADGRDERLVSDPVGRVASALHYGSQPLTVDFAGEIDPRDLIQTTGARTERSRFEPRVTVAHDVAAATPVDVALAVGPTLRLDVTLPVGYEAEDVLGVLTTRSSVAAFDKLYARGVARAGLVHLRFAPFAHLIGGGAPLGLRVGTDDGAWYAELEVDEPWGIQPVESVVLAPRTGLSGALVDAAGEPLHRQFVQLHPVVAPGVEDDRSPVYALAEDGRYVMRWVPAGPVRLKVNAEGYDPYEEELLLPEGPFEHDIRLASDEVARDAVVAGTVRSRSGAFAGPASVVLIVTAPQEAAGYNVSEAVVFEEEEGAVVGRFTFEGLREDSRFTLMLLVDGRTVEPARIDAEPGANDVDFVVHDDVAVRALRARAVDAETEEPITTFEVRLTFLAGGGGSLAARIDADEDGVARKETLRTDARFEWVASARGYVPAFGDERACVEDEGDLRLDLRLRAGWGARVVALDEDRQPLSGVRVLVDGVDLGATDAAGILDVSTETVPGRLELERDGWRQVDASGPENAFTPWVPVQRIRMTRTGD